MAYGLAARGVARSAQRARTAEMLELLQIAALAERLPRELSGGQQQRVALALQQGQIDISPGNFNAIQILEARGVPVEFVKLKEDTIASKTTAHVVKNSPNKALAAALIESAMSPKVQSRLIHEVAPTQEQRAGSAVEGDARDVRPLQQRRVEQPEHHDEHRVDRRRCDHASADERPERTVREAMARAGRRVEGGAVEVLEAGIGVRTDSIPGPSASYRMHRGSADGLGAPLDGRAG